MILRGVICKVVNRFDMKFATGEDRRGAVQDAKVSNECDVYFMWMMIDY